MGPARMVLQPFRLLVVGVLFGIARVLILLLVNTWRGLQRKLAQLKTALRIVSAVNTLLKPIALETIGVYFESTGVILRAKCRHLVEATAEPREGNWFRQNVAIEIIRRGTRRRMTSFDFISILTCSPIS